MSVERIEIFRGNKKIATHERRFGKNKWCLKPEHYLSLLLRRPGAFESARPIREWRKSWPKVFNELLERFRNEHCIHYRGGCMSRTTCKKFKSQVLMA